MTAIFLFGWMAQGGLPVAFTLSHNSQSNHNGEFSRKVMSFILFLVGLVFVFISLLHTIHESAITTSTLTMAGMGMADCVLRFYTHPWKDVSLNLLQHPAREDAPCPTFMA